MSAPLFLLLLLLLTPSLSVVPQCSYACDDPVCSAVCVPRCPPNSVSCATVCSLPGNPCALFAPSCLITCARNQVVNTSRVPECEVHCATLAPACTSSGCAIECAPLIGCGWDCSKNDSCPRPRCEQMCELPLYPYVSSGASFNVIGGLLLLLLLLV
jgi:hypothetical protein